MCECICIRHGLSGLVKNEFYRRKIKENTMVCLDSKRQKATKKMWVFIVLGTCATGETFEMFAGNQEKKANTKFMDLPCCRT